MSKRRVLPFGLVLAAPLVLAGCFPSDAEIDASVAGIEAIPGVVTASADVSHTMPLQTAVDLDVEIEPEPGVQDAVLTAACADELITSLDLTVTVDPAQVSAGTLDPCADFPFPLGAVAEGIAAAVGQGDALVAAGPYELELGITTDADWATLRIAGPSLPAELVAVQAALVRLPHSRVSVDGRLDTSVQDADEMIDRIVDLLVADAEVPIDAVDAQGDDWEVVLPAGLTQADADLVRASLLGADPELWERVVVRVAP